MGQRRLKRKLEKLEEEATQAAIPDDRNLTRFIEYYGRGEEPRGNAAEHWPEGEKAPKGPVDFVEEVLGAEPTEYQKKILQDCVRQERIAWRAAHGCGKTASLSWIVLWWLLTRPFSRVLIVAPAFQRQIGRYLLPEVRKWKRSARNNSGIELPVNVRAESVEVEGYSRQWFALAIQASDPSKVEGGHNESLCVLADEAKGLDSQVIEALHGTQTDVSGDRLYFLASTPGGPSGPFYDVFREGGKIWKLHHTSALDSPIVSDEWIAQRREEWGEHSPVYKARVLGEFPEEEEGQLFRLSDLEAAQSADIEVEDDAPVVFGVDVSRFGADLSVIAVWKGGELKTLIARQGGETPHIAGWVAREANRWDPDKIVIEDIGIGSGVIDNLKPHNPNGEIVSLNTGEPAEEIDQYNRLRSEIYWQFKQAVERGDEIKLPGDGYLGEGLNAPKGQDLIAELSSIKYEYDDKNKIKVESKDKLKNRTGNSPDLADAAMLGYYGIGGGAGFTVAIGGRFV